VEHGKLRREVEIAEQAIAALSLVAPQDGIAVLPDHPWEGRKLVAGDMVQPGWAVVELPDQSAMQVTAYLSDVDDGQISAGTQVTCRLDAHPDLPLSGTIEEITQVAHEVGRRSLRRAFHVRISLGKTDSERMRPGMSVLVDVPGPVVTGALLAPRGGLDLSGEQPQAVLAGGQRVPVELGACDAHHCVVERGLAEGQKLELGGAG
jgi:multidrug resistance efflux pump